MGHLRRRAGGRDAIRHLENDREVIGAGMAGPVSVKVKKTGRVKKPTLDHGQLTTIGQAMVDKQKQRWAQGINAEGMRAKPLAKPYLYRKAKIRRTNRPIRDLHLTGLLLSNFTLRKAINGVIRAEA